MASDHPPFVLRVPGCLRALLALPLSPTPKTRARAELQIFDDKNNSWPVLFRYFTIAVIIMGVVIRAPIHSSKKKKRRKSLRTRVFAGETATGAVQNLEINFNVTSAS